MRPSPRTRKAKAAFAASVRPLLVTAAALTLVATGAWAAWARVIPYVAGHDYFRLRTIRISSDETRVAPQTLAEIAGLYEDESLWNVDPDAIRQNLRDASWVRSASVSRHFPWQVTLSVSRRHAAAAAVVDGKAFLVDRDGVLFREVQESSAADLPYLTGWDKVSAHAERAVRLRALIGVLAEADRHSVDVSELHMDDDGTVWLYAASTKASVRLGAATRAAVGFDRFAIALKELGPLADRARLIDTDYDDRIVIRGADDKLPAMLVAQSEKALSSREGAPATSMPASQGTGATPAAAARGVTKSASPLRAKGVPAKAASAKPEHKASRHG